MYIDYFPWWEGKIGISFTREEWECIASSLELTLHDRCVGNEGQMERDILDYIQKNLGTE